MDSKILVGTGVITFVIFAFVMFSALDYDLQKAYTIPGFAFTDGNELPSVTCFIKQTTLIVDQDDRVFASEQSPFLIQNPRTFAFTVEGGSGEEIKGFFVEPKIRCNTSIGDGDGILDPDASFPEINQFIEDQERVCALPSGVERTNRAGDSIKCLAPNDIGFVIEDVILVVSVVSVDINGNKKITYVDTFDTNEKTVIAGQEQQLGGFWIPFEKIADDLSPGNYNSFQEIRVEGLLQTHYLGFPFPKYNLLIENQDIPTFVNVQVSQDETPTKTDDEIPPPDTKDDTPGDESDDPPDDSSTSADTSDTQREGLEKQEEALEKEKTRQELLSDSLDSIFLTEFLSCATQQDLQCLDNSKFGIIWAGIGLIGIAIVFETVRKKR